MKVRVIREGARHVFSGGLPVATRLGDTGGMVSEERVARTPRQGFLHIRGRFVLKAVLEAGPGERIVRVDVAAGLQLTPRDGKRLFQVPVMVREKQSALPVVQDAKPVQARMGAGVGVGVVTARLPVMA